MYCKIIRGVDLLLHSTDPLKKKYISGQIVTVSMPKQFCYMIKNEFAWYLSQQTLQVLNAGLRSAVGRAPDT